MTTRAAPATRPTRG
ncbi:hypothetical protein STRIP9103_02956, partial [Streptomyces ipomoeae 91-03]